MSSIIEGYNYFISYRQKDNKGEKWVSCFVEELKNELERTFKENVSIYFDENPHDRLQETHNVGKSLEHLISIMSQMREEKMKLKMYPGGSPLNQTGLSCFP